jgi:hypothetical protein
MTASAETSEILRLLKRSGAVVQIPFRKRIGRLLFEPAVRAVYVALNIKHVAERLKREFTHPDLLYPGEGWALEQLLTIRIGFEEVSASPGPGVILLLNETGEAKLFLAPPGSFLDISQPNVRFHLTKEEAPAYKVEIRGNLQDPKSLENDFFVIDAARRIPLPDFVNRHYRYQADGTRHISKFATENNGIIAIHRETGEASVLPRSRLKITQIRPGRIDMVGLVSATGIFPNTVTPMEFVPVFQYHFHPSRDFLTISPGDINGWQKILRKDGIAALLPELVLNYEGKGKLYLPSMKSGRMEGAFRALNSVSDLIDPNQYLSNPDTARKWESELMKYFQIFEIDFDAEGRVRSFSSLSGHRAA